MLAAIKKCEQKRDKAIEATKASLWTSTKGLYAKMRHARVDGRRTTVVAGGLALGTSFRLGGRCVRRLNDHTRSRDEDRKLQVAASEALSLAQAAW